MLYDIFGFFMDVPFRPDYVTFSGKFRNVKRSRLGTDCGDKGFYNKVQKRRKKKGYR